MMAWKGWVAGHRALAALVYAGLVAVTFLILGWGNTPLLILGGAITMAVFTGWFFAAPRLLALDASMDHPARLRLMLFVLGGVFVVGVVVGFVMAALQD
jgi:hypothetical protein